MKLVILGGPGAGKGTQAALLCSQLGIPLVSTGEILREEIAAKTDLGKEAESYVEEGELVPDRTMISFIRKRLVQPDTAKGWLLDGYPRTAFQAEELDFLLDELGQRLRWAIYLKLPDSVLMDRCLNRQDGRLDDREEIVQRRIDLFNDRTIPILEYYGYRDRLLTIDAAGAPDRVLQEILQGVDPSKG